MSSRLSAGALLVVQCAGRFFGSSRDREELFAMAPPAGCGGPNRPGHAPAGLLPAQSEVGAIG